MVELQALTLVYRHDCDTVARSRLYRIAAQVFIPCLDEVLQHRRDVGGECFQTVEERRHESRLIASYDAYEVFSKVVKSLLHKSLALFLKLCHNVRCRQRDIRPCQFVLGTCQHLHGIHYGNHVLRCIQSEGFGRKHMQALRLKIVGNLTHFALPAYQYGNVALTRTLFHQLAYNLIYLFGRLRCLCRRQQFYVYQSAGILVSFCHYLLHVAVCTPQVFLPFFVRYLFYLCIGNLA